jgi:hypothetical protein
VLGLRAASLLAVMLSAGCAASGAQDTRGSERGAFPAGTGLIETMPNKTDEIVDIGLPPLPNNTSHAIRLKSVAFLNPPADLRVLNVRAYNYRQTREGITWMAGDLAKECPQTFIPHSISSFVTSPRATTQWFPIIAFTISRPAATPFSVPGSLGGGAVDQWRPSSSIQPLAASSRAMVAFRSSVAPAASSTRSSSPAFSSHGLWSQVASARPGATTARPDQPRQRVREP